MLSQVSSSVISSSQGLLPRGKRYGLMGPHPITKITGSAGPELALFYGTDSEMNLSVLLPGLVQSNQRAELLAVLLSCLRDPRRLDIRTDSEYVCKGMPSFRQWGPFRVTWGAC